LHQGLSIEISWQELGEIKLTAEGLRASALPNSPGIYRIRLLKPDQTRWRAYIGQSQNIDHRIGDGHTSGPFAGLMLETLTHGGSVRVDVLSARSANEDGTFSGFTVERKLARLMIESLAVALDINAFDDLLNHEHIIDDDIPAQVRTIQPWWL
jgi:hypothetical protein